MRRRSLDAGSVRVVDTSVAPASAYLGVLGMTGLTAYAGLTRDRGHQAGRRRVRLRRGRGRRLLVGQVAKALGAGRVIGSAGSQEKVDHLLDDLGFDAAFNYKDGKSEPARRPRPTASTSTSTTSAASAWRPRSAPCDSAGIVVCGAISQYNATEPPPGPRNLARLIQTRGSYSGLPRGGPLGPRR